jgi:hypothetical protein
MAVADSRYRFTFVDIGAYGRQGDAGVFARSSLGRALKSAANPLRLPSDGVLPGTNEPFPFVFIADAAFPIGPHLMKPFVGRNLTQAQRIYNYRHSRARRCVEQAFGLLVKRWSILKNLDVHPEHADSIVKATVVLHNFVSRDAEPATEHVDSLPDNDIALENDVNAGTNARDRLVDFFNSEAGFDRVPFQQNVANRGE